MARSILRAFGTLPPLRAPRPDPPFPLVSSASFGSARSSPGREAAKRTLDGEDRSDTMKHEGKGGSVPSLPAGINEDESDPHGAE